MAIGGVAGGRIGRGTLSLAGELLDKLMEALEDIVEECECEGGSWRGWYITRLDGHMVAWTVWGRK